MTFLSTFLLVLFPICCFAGKIDPPISAPHAILMNMETGQILYEKNAFTPYPPASTSKIATALYLLEKGIPLDQEVVVKRELIGTVSPAIKRANPAAHPPYRLESDGTMMHILPGETLTVGMLLHGLMLPSGNDAANVLAHHISGSVEGFVEELGSFLKEKGIVDTNFLNPHGLPDKRHLTTAYDLACIARMAMTYPAFQDVVKKPFFTLPATNKQGERIIWSNNLLIRKGKYHYPRAIGLKTGYTIASKHNIVAAATNGERSLIAVIFGAPDKTSRYQDATALFDAAFAEQPVSRVLFSKEDEAFTYSYEGAKAPIRAGLADDAVVSYYLSESPAFEARVKWDHPVLPIAQGAKVGEIEIVSDWGEAYATLPLYASKEVLPTFSESCKNFFKQFKQHHRKTTLFTLLGFGIPLALFSLRRKS